MSAYTNVGSFIVTSDTAKLPSSQANFPLLFIGNAKLATVANGGFATSGSGFDVVFGLNEFDPTTRLDHDLVGGTYNAVTGSGTWWIRIPTLAIGLRVFIFVGNAAIVSTQSTNTTWPSQFKAVYHFGDGSSVSGADATSNAQTLTNTGAGANTGPNGIKGAVSTNGSTSYMNRSASAPVTANTVAIAFWIYATVGSGVPWSMLDQGSGQWNGYYGTINSATVLAPIVAVKDNFAVAEGAYTSLTLNAWHRVWGCNASVTSRVSYIDGVAGTPGTTNVTPSVAPSGIAIGCSYTNVPANYATMSASEFYVLNAIPSADWITADFNNQNSPTTFYTQDAWFSTSLAASRIGNNIRPRPFAPGLAR